MCICLLAFDGRGWRKHSGWWKWGLCACWAGERQDPTREKLPVGLKYSSERGNGVGGLGSCSVTLGEIQRNFYFFFFPKPTSGDIFCLLSVFSRALRLFQHRFVPELSVLLRRGDLAAPSPHLKLYLVPLQSTGMLFCTPCRQRAAVGMQDERSGTFKNNLFICWNFITKMLTKCELFHSPFLLPATSFAGFFCFC